MCCSGGAALIAGMADGRCQHTLGGRCGVSERAALIGQRYYWRKQDYDTEYADHFVPFCLSGGVSSAWLPAYNRIDLSVCPLEYDFLYGSHGVGLGL